MVSTRHLACGTSLGAEARQTLLPCGHPQGSHLRRSFRVSIELQQEVNGRTLQNQLIMSAA